LASGHWPVIRLLLNPTWIVPLRSRRVMKISLPMSRSRTILPAQRARWPSISVLEAGLRTDGGGLHVLVPPP
jgi:hypothetical protein